MKAIVDSRDFCRAFSWLNLTKRGSLNPDKPGLVTSTWVLRDEKLTIGVKDGATEARISMPASILDPGVAAVRTTVLPLALAQLPQSKLKVDGSGSMMEIDNYEGVQLSLPMTPDVQAWTDTPTGGHTLSSSLFLRMVIAVRHALPGDDVNPAVYNGIVVDITESLIRLWATDGHRLASVTHPVEGMVPARYLMPAHVVAAVFEALRHTEKEDVPIACVQDETRICLTIGERIIIAPCQTTVKIQAIERIMSQPTDIQSSVEQSSLIDAIRRAGIMAEDIAVSVRLKGSGTRLEVESGLTGTEARDIIDMESNEDFWVKVNRNYLRDAVKAVNTKALRLLIPKAHARPIYVENVGDDMLCRLAIMPLR